MLVLMRCVAEAVMHKGVRGLTDLVPGATYLCEVAGDAVKRLRDRQRAADLRKDVEDAAAATLDEVRRAAAEVAREVASAGPVEDRIALEMYLTQLPGAIRQSLRRADDPSGKTVPPDLAVDDAADLARRLPTRVARFRPGDELPGRSGWRLAEFLGSGGFGEVWLAHNPALSALRGAVKFGLDPAARERLLRHEGSLVNRVMAHGRHPNVVQLLDAHLDGDAPWLMYEYVPGGDLSHLILAWQRLPAAERVDRAFEALRVLASAVAAFHRQSPPIVHRDLKPGNVLVADGGLKVADFGIGGVAAAALAREATRRGSTGLLASQLQGSFTPLYAGPQQRRGESPDPRDDVHALGVIGFQMLTGRLDAAPGADYAKTLRRLGAPDALVELLGDCAAQDADNRPRDAGELAERLDGLDRKPVPPAEVRPPRGDRARRRKSEPLPIAEPVEPAEVRPARVAAPPPPPPVRPQAPRTEPEPQPAGRPGPSWSVVRRLIALALIVAAVYLAWQAVFSGSDGTPESNEPLRTSAEFVRRIDTGRFAVHDIRLSPDGTMAAADLLIKNVFSQESQYGLYRLTNGGLITVGRGARSVGFSPDSQRCAVPVGRVLDPESDVEVLSAATGTKVYGLTTVGRERVGNAGFAPGGRTVFAVGKRVWLWDVDSPAAAPAVVTGPDGKDLPTDSGNLVFDPTGTRFAVRSAAPGGVAVGRVDGWKVRRQVGTKDDRFAAFTRSGDRLVAWGGKEVVVWDVETGERKAGHPADGGEPRQLLLAPDDSRVIAVGSERAVALDLAGRAAGVPLGEHPAKVARAAYHPAGEVLATVDEQGTIRVRRAATPDRPGVALSGHTGVIRDVGFTADGKTLVAGGDDGIFVWSVR